MRLSLGVDAALSGAVGAARAPREARRPWLFLAAAVVFWVGGASFGTVATAAAYPLFAVALLLLLREKAARSATVALDALLIAVALATAFWQLPSFGARPTVGAFLLLVVLVAWLALVLHREPALPAAAIPALRRFLALAVPVLLVPAVLLLHAATTRTMSLVDGILVSVALLLLLGRLGVVVWTLERARADLRDENHLKDELISVVSHDLRTPLTSIMGYLELALSEETDAQAAREFLEVVQRNTERLHRLVEDLLFVSRLQQGREALVLEPVDVARVAAETAAASLPAARSAGVELSCAVECHDAVLADGHRIAEVLENLLSNAIKFTPPGGYVDVWIGRIAGACVLRVSDTGVGIADEDREHLFDRFYRARGSHGVPGAGLGLSIVKVIVDAHGGRIAVHSREGAGTTFEVRLPLHVLEREPVAA